MVASREPEEPGRPGGEFTRAEHGFMQRALELARSAGAAGEVPVGAVLVLDGQIVGEGANGPIGAGDPTAHAEILALRAGARALGNYRLAGTTLFVTMEPCVMCAGALLHARVARLIYGAAAPRTGAIQTTERILDNAQANHRVSYAGGLLAGQASTVLQNFFAARRT